MENELSELESFNTAKENVINELKEEISKKTNRINQLCVGKDECIIKEKINYQDAIDYNRKINLANSEIAKLKIQIEDLNSFIKKAEKIES